MPTRSETNAARRGPPLARIALIGVASCGEAADETRDPNQDAALDLVESAEIPRVGDADMVDFSCPVDNWTPPPCTQPTIEFTPGVVREHVGEPTTIEYESIPPATGPHRPIWARWGEYEFVPPQRWLHNLEHGGVALLYHPCAAPEVIDALREFAQNRPADRGGAFRWILSPAPGIETTMAVVAWEWRMLGSCVDTDSIQTFVDAHYRRAPEDVSIDGTYNRLWLGR